MYIISIIIYIPIGIYAGHYRGLDLFGALKMLLFDGTFYHLWYFPACIIGVLLVYGMSRWLDIGMMTAIAVVLYIVGLLGDSYYGLTVKVPALNVIYNAMFRVFSYTRNGFFSHRYFLCLESGRRNTVKNIRRRKACWVAVVIHFNDGGGLCASRKRYAEA